LITSEKLVASSVAQVERRHAQAERIAEIKPVISVHPKNGFTTTLQGGAIGKVDVARLGESQVMAHLLQDLSVFTRATGDEEFEILSVGSRDDQGRRRVAFRQLIGGIPVDFQSKLEVGPDGDVWKLITRVFDPSAAPPKLLSEQEARRIASDAIQRKFGHLGIEKIDWIPAELEYVAKATSQEDYGVALTPTWRVPARITATNDPLHALGETALVVINANTAEANIIPDTTLYSPY
jgi:Zn-dependent metalloprotease